jgi:hypothetical protein
MLALVLTLGAVEQALAQGATWEFRVARTSSLVRTGGSQYARSNQNRLGFAPSVAVAQNARPVAFRVEVALVPKGFERTRPTYHWTYLEVPLLVELRPFGDSAAIQPQVHAGMAPGLAMSCSVEYQTAIGLLGTGCAGSNPLSLSWVLGFGVRLNAGAYPLLFEVRRTNSVTTVLGDYRHVVVSLGVGVGLARRRAA